MKERALVIGASGHAKVAIDAMERQGKYEIVGILDRRLPGPDCCGYPLLGPDDRIAEIAGKMEVRLGFVAIGDNWLRSMVVNRIREAVPEFSFLSATHPTATVGRDVIIGEGTVLMAGAVVNPGSVIGAHCIVNTRASLDHDSRMGDFSSLAPGVVTGGSVSIGSFSAVCVGATVIHGISVGEHSVVGAGATVVADVPPFTTAYGAPARVVRSRGAGEKYL